MRQAVGGTYVLPWGPAAAPQGAKFLNLWYTNCKVPGASPRTPPVFWEKAGPKTDDRISRRCAALAGSRGGVLTDKIHCTGLRGWKEGLRLESFIAEFQNIITSFGASVGIPVFIVLVGLILRLRPAQAARSGLTAGVCLAAMLLLGGTLRTTLAQLAVEIGGTSELGMPAVDAGWEPSTVIAFASRLGIYIIPIYLFINLVMLALRATRTFNFDLWNFWHAAFIGAMAEVLTGSFVLGLLAVISAVILLQCLSDMAARPLQKHLGTPGVSVTQGFSLAFVPIALVLNKLFDLIPGWKKHPVTLETLQRKLGFGADPLVLGAVIGGGLSALAGRDVYGVLQDAVSLAAAVFLLPRILKLFAEAFAPIGEGLRHFAKEKLKIGGSLYLGFSSTIATASPTVLLTTMALIPPLMWTARSASFAQYMPAASLYMLPFVMALVVAVCRGDILRSLVAGYVSMVSMLYCGSALAGLFTQAAMTANPDLYGSVGLITSITDASSPLAWFVVMVATFGLAGLLALLIFSIGLAMWNHNQITGKGGGPLFTLPKFSLGGGAAAKALPDGGSPQAEPEAQKPQEPPESPKQPEDAGRTAGRSKPSKGSRRRDPRPAGKYAKRPSPPAQPEEDVDTEAFAQLLSSLEAPDTGTQLELNLPENDAEGPPAP